MGDRGHLLRALSAAAAATLCAGCLDFVEPELPERGAPAVAQISVVLTDSGTLSVTGTLAPGFDEDGLRRRIFDATITAAGELFEPLDTTEAGALRYSSSRRVEADSLDPPIEVRGPRLQDVLRWPVVLFPALRRLDADTVMRADEGSVRLHVALRTTGSPGQPEPGNRQWFLTLAGEEDVFRLSADGPPPAELDIPPQFLPAGRIAARLIYQQSATIREPDYTTLITLDQRVHWIIRAAGPR